MSSSTFTPNLGIEQMTTGSHANTWGDVTNRSLNVIDAAIGGSAPIQLTGTPGSAQVLTTTPGVEPTPGVYPLLVWTGGQTAAGAVTIAPPSEQRLFVMKNQTAATIAFNQGNGSQFTLQPHYDAYIYCDGAGPGANVSAALGNPQFANMLVTGTLTIQGSLTGNLSFGNASAATMGLGSPTSVPDPLTINGLGPAAQCQIRLVAAANNNYGALLRNDGNTLWIQATAANTPYGAAAVSAFSVNLANGAVTANAGFSSPTIQSTGPLYAGTTVFTANLNAVGSIAIDTGQTNGGGIDLFFGGNTEGIGSARSGGAGANQGGLSFFTANAPRLVILNNGQVGINMFPVDSSALTVSGAIRTTGGIIFPDGSLQTSAVSGTFTQLTVTGNATIGGTLTLGGNMSVTNGNINLAAGHTYQINGVPLSSGIAGINFYYFNSNQFAEPGIQISGGTNVQVVISHTAPGQFGTYTINFIATCDERVKRNVQPLQGGLSIINQLHPIEGQYNGLAGTRDGERVVGVMAHELQRVLPECVYSTPVKLHKDDVQLTDVLYVNTQELLFHVILAIRQLYERSEVVYGRWSS